MPKYSAQAGLAIHRLRNGDTLYLSFELGSIPLFQSVDKQTGNILPNWTVPANQPVIFPHASTARGNVVALSNHSWTYNGALLIFNGATTGGYTADSTGKFAMDTITGALKIINNLASQDNLSNDTLLYSVTATVSGVEYNVSKSIDVQIQSAGASSYFGFINASTTQLDSEHESASLGAVLWLSTAPVSTYYVKWYKGNTEWVEKAGQKVITINRSDIDASGLIIAEFYNKSTDTNYVARAAITIIDTLDEIMAVLYISSANKIVSPGNPVTVATRIVKASDGSVLQPVNPTYLYQIFRGDTWELVGTSTNDTINVTTAHTDTPNGNYAQVEVFVNVAFDSLQTQNQ